MNTTKKQDKSSVGRILLLVAACIYPIPFLFLAAWREAKDVSPRNQPLLTCGLGSCTVGFFMLLSMLCGFMLDTTDRGPLFLALLWIPYLISGGCLLALYAALMRRNRRFHRCRTLICSEHITSVAKLSEILGLSREKTQALLRQMIEKGLLEGASLPEPGDELVFARSVWARQYVVCCGCGADQVVNFGETLTCAYCGSALKARRISDPTA